MNYTRYQLRHFARHMRYNPTDAEHTLWQHLYITSPLMGSLHNSILVLSQDQIDDVCPFASPLWIPAYAGMTVVVQSTLDGRGLEPAPGLNRG